MTKRLMSILLIVAALLMAGGCGSQGPDKPDEPPVNDETLVVINGQQFHLSREASFKDLDYLAVEEFNEANHDEHISYVQYNYYQEDQTNLLFFRIFHYQNRGTDYALKDLGIEGKVDLSDGRTDNIEYQLYAQPRDDGGTMHFYFIHLGKDTYVLNFVSRYDIADFETRTLNSVRLAR